MSLANAMQRTLEARGFSVRLCHDGVDALRLLQDDPPDAALLDLGLPRLDGLALLGKLRQGGSDVPVLVVTGRAAIGDRVQTLMAGADDFLSKPFDIDELEARLRALLRRRLRCGLGSVACGRLRLEIESGAFYVDDHILELTPREQAFLTALIRRPGVPVSRDRLFRAVFSAGDDVRAQALDVIAHRVRRKLERCDVGLKTLRGVGYLLHAEPAAARG